RPRVAQRPLEIRLRRGHSCLTDCRQAQTEALDDLGHLLFFARHVRTVRAHLPGTGFRRVLHPDQFTSWHGTGPRVRTARMSVCRGRLRSMSLMLLDTASLYFRAFFGVPDSLRAPSGVPVNAVRGLLDTIAW